MIKNQEFKSIVVKLIILQIIFALIGFIVVNIFMDNMNTKIVKRDMALVGNIIKDHPELEKEIIPYITKEVSRESLISGQEVLEGYGYKIEMNKYLQPLFKTAGLKLEVIIFFLIVLFIIPLSYMVAREYEKIYKKVEEVSNAAEKVVEGDFTICLKEEGEGNFSILNHQFNQMVNRLENSLDTLKKEKAFLKNMISDISHQLKTPLSSLIIFNDLLLQDESMELETRLNFLEKTKSQLERIEWLTINLLKVARIEAGAIEFKKEKVLLKDTLDIALSTLSFNFGEQCIELGGDLGATFYGDKDWTGEALINIIKNAMEHSKGNIKIKIEDGPLFSSIIVKDNGDGIDTEYLPHIFERFYKVNSQVKPDSIGIGLNLSKLIVESQEGTISVKSKKGHGTEITVTFRKRKN